MQSSVSQDHKVHNINYADLVGGIESFDNYLQEEYEALFDNVFVFEQNRSDSPLDQLKQQEYELRLELITFVKQKYKEKVISLLNSTSF